MNDPKYGIGESDAVIMANHVDLLAADVKARFNDERYGARLVKRAVDRACYEHTHALCILSAALSNHVLNSPQTMFMTGPGSCQSVRRILHMVDELVRALACGAENKVAENGAHLLYTTIELGIEMDVPIGAVFAEIYRTVLVRKTDGFVEPKIADVIAHARGDEASAP